MTRLVLRPNAAWPTARPALSVLIPFLGDDPSRLIAALDGMSPLGLVEILVLDDGGSDRALSRRVRDATAAVHAPAMFIRSATNLGRAKGRNRLARHARADYLLFLDADMAPDCPAFLATYLELMSTAGPAVAFGGFSLRQAPTDAAFALHRTMALASDCTPAESRRRQPAKHVFTSNLLVRRAVFMAEPFDESFHGWGWEDVEWAMRVAARHPIVHIDNTATHLGLEPAPVIAAKYEQSAPNFARIAARHRSVVARYPSYRAAKVLKRLPFLHAWRPWLKRVALAEGAPLGSRALAMRLYRAALYAEAV
ncbi:MAG TPA: glycosyltransferase family A protein [Caulobacteraceae bacterium]|nr:glycosyltransferase family A protein [Caulobacteraceae bacterium]